jgi:hypothetical protein
MAIRQYGYMAVFIRAGVKATFTFDEATIRRIAEASARLGRPKSQIVREAIHEYHERLDRLSDRQRDSMLRDFDALAPAIPARARTDVNRELREVRRARRTAGTRRQSRA